MFHSCEVLWLLMLRPSRETKVFASMAICWEHQETFNAWKGDLWQIVAIFRKFLRALANEERTT